MKNIKQKPRSLKRTILISLAGVVLVGAVLFILERARITDIVKNPFYTPAKISPVDKANQADPTTGSKKDIPSSSATPGVDPSKTTDQVPVNKAAALTITLLAQSNGSVIYTAQVSSNVEDGGVCTATFENSAARPVVRTSTASNHTCGPVSIPETEFTVLGKWTLIVRYFANSQQVSNQQEINIQ